MTQQKDKLQELLNKRSKNPLFHSLPITREAVEPANFYGGEAPIVDVTKKMREVVENQTSEIAKGLAHVEEPIPLSQMSIQKRAVNTTSDQMIKFASYIPLETHRALKFLAIQEDKKMYEVIRDAIQYYMQKKLAGRR